MGGTSSIEQYEENLVIGEVMINYKNAVVEESRVFHNNDPQKNASHSEVISQAVADVNKNVHKFIHDHVDNREDNEIVIHRSILALSKQYNECSVLRNELRSMMQVHGTSIVEAVDLYIYFYQRSKPHVYLQFRREAITQLNKMLEKIFELQKKIEKEEKKAERLMLVSFFRGMLNIVWTIISGHQVTFIYKQIRFRVRELQEIAFLRRMVRDINMELQKIRDPISLIKDNLGQVDPGLAEETHLNILWFAKVVEENCKLKAILDDYNISYESVQSKAEVINNKDDAQSMARIEDRQRLIKQELERIEEQERKSYIYRIRCYGTI